MWDLSVCILSQLKKTGGVKYISSLLNNTHAQFGAREEEEYISEEKYIFCIGEREREKTTLCFITLR